MSPVRLAVLLFLLPKPPDFRRTNWPMMGISVETGVIGYSGVDFPEGLSGNGSFTMEEDNEEDVELLAVVVADSAAGWLYIQVAVNTVEAPIINDGVMLKSNRATEAKKDRTIDREVAKPFRMLSEYLMTIAVTRPPMTWIATVAHAHAPK